MSNFNVMYKLGTTLKRGRKSFGLLICFIMFGISSSIAVDSYAQMEKFSINANNKSMKEVFHYIEKNSQYVFFYINNEIDLNKRVSINCKNKRIDDVLSELFKGTSYIYHISNRQIFVSTKNSVKQASPQQQQRPATKRKITGRVTDEKGHLLSV